jgi:hypothetical protein
MRLGDNNLLTRIVNAVRKAKLAYFSARDIDGLIAEGGRTPHKSINACLSSKCDAYEQLGNYPAYFVRTDRGYYRLLEK